MFIIQKRAFIFTHMSPCRLHSQYTATADFESALKVNSLIIKPSVPLTMDFKIKWEGLVVLIRPELHRSYLSKVLSNMQLPKISRYFKAGSC